MSREAQGVICYITTTTVASTNITLGEVVGFSGPQMSANVIDVTNLASTAKEKLVGVYDGGNLTLNLNCMATDSGQQKAREVLASRSKSALIIQLSGSTTTHKIALEGYVSGLGITGAVDGKLAADLTFAISGGVSWSN